MKTMFGRLLVQLGAILASLAFASVAVAQATQPVPEANAYRYDGIGRLVGEIGPDPDGGGPLGFPAKRTVYDTAGLVVRVETGELAAWQPTSTSPSSWPNFTIFTSENFAHDTMGRVVRAWVVGQDGQTESLVQTNYDKIGRPACTAVRMDKSGWPNPPQTNACIPDSSPSAQYGSDRITRNYYDGLGQLRQVRKGVGSTSPSVEIADVTYTYTADGLIKYVIDANGNRAEMRYDGHRRQIRWVFPSVTRPPAFSDANYTTADNTAGSLNENDFEAYTYDYNGNRKTLTKRDGSVITYNYDALNQLTSKVFTPSSAMSGLDPIHTQSVFYTYDLRGLQTSARFGSISGNGIVNQYTGFGELKKTTNTLLGMSTAPELAFLYDANGNRTRITHPDGAYFEMAYDIPGRLKTITKGSDVLLTATYGPKGGVEGIARLGAAHDQSYGYDTLARLSSIGIASGGASSNVNWTYTRNPASQILTERRDNNAYAWDDRVDGSGAYTTNGLNQYSAINATGQCYDKNGNLTDDGATYVYRYDVENRLVEMRVRQAGSPCPLAPANYSGQLRAKLTYDPLGRLLTVERWADSNGVAVLAATTKFVHDGDALVSEYDGSNALTERYVHGSNAKADDPLLWYHGTSTLLADVRNLYADPRGSIVLVAGQDGTVVGTNRYDEWGVSTPTANVGRFQYTGQAWLDEIGMYYYKARIYAPRLGRFMQTDPIGYEGGNNLYAYVGNDPINAIDPDGKQIEALYYPPEGATPEELEDWREGTTTGTIIGGSITFDILNTPISPGPDASITVFGTKTLAKATTAGARRPGAVGRFFNWLGKPFRAFSERSIFRSGGESLKGRTVGEVRKLFRGRSDWVETVGKDGKSTVFREITPRGDYTGKNIRFNPEGTHHPGEYPYWTVNDGTSQFGRFWGKF